MITPVLDLLMESKDKLDKSKQTFDSMLMETMELLFSIAAKTDPHASGAWQSVKENGWGTILDFRKKGWGTTEWNSIYYIHSGRTVKVQAAPYLYFCEGGVEAFYFDDDDGRIVWYLFSEEKKFQHTEDDEDGTKEENGNLH